MLHYYKEQGGDEMLKRKAYDKLKQNIIFRRKENQI